MLNILGVVNNRSYGIWNKNILKALLYLNYDYSFFPLHPIQLETYETDFQLPIKTGMDNAKFFDPLGTSLCIWHEFDQALQVGENKTAWTLWELDRLNSLQKHHLNSLECLIVPSRWHLEIAKSSLNNIAIDVCPLGVDTSKFYPINLKSRDKTIFLSVGKWEKRKGHDVLPQIFSKAFSPKDNVELRISHNNPFLSPEEIQSWKNLYSKIPSHQINFIETWLTENDLNVLYNQADVGICLSRAEGFGLPNLEMLACGLPLVVTNYAAHTEYLNNDNACLVSIDETELAVDGKWFHGEGNWAKIGKNQEEQAIEYLRKLHKEKQENGILRNLNGLVTAENLSWLNIAQKLIGLI